MTQSSRKLDSLTVQIKDKFTVSAAEDLFLNFFSRSLSAKIVEFDFSSLSWIGYYPATLLLTWIVSLKRSGFSDVRICLPSRQNLPPQPRKILLEYGILTRIAEAGIETPYSSQPIPHLGIPITCLKSRESLWDVTRMASNTLLATLSSELSPGFQQVIAEICDIILFEFGENSFHHANGEFPHFGVAFARSGGQEDPSRRNTGMMAVFPKDTPYVEIVYGDAGPGIGKVLSKYLPTDYLPPFPKDLKFSKEERVLAFAFEFSSTSDEKKRLERIAELLTSKNDTIDVQNVASGLFCVMQVAKARRGQIVVRTPTAELSVNFFPDPSSPRITGKSDLGVSKLARIPGTHYLLRLPFLPPCPTEFRQGTSQTSFSVPEIQLFDPFPSTQKDVSLPDFIGRAINSVDEHLRKNRNRHGLLLIPPVLQSLPSRAMSLFLASLQAMVHGKQKVLWLDPLAPHTSGSSLQKTSSKVLNDDLAAPVFVGGLWPNTFHCNGRIPHNIDSSFYFKEEKAHLLQEVIPEARKAYVVWLRQRLEEIISKPEIRQTDGPFLIEGQYYTEIFYEVPKALADPKALRLMAEWCFSEIGTPPEVLVGETCAIRPLLTILAQLFVEAGHKAPEIFEWEPPFSPARIANKTIEHLGRRSVVITDVICRRETLRRFLGLLGAIKIQSVITLVNASSKLDGKFIFLPGRSGEIQLPIRSLIDEVIPTHRDPPPTIETRYIDQEIPDFYERVVIIDKTTHSPTVYVRKEQPQVNLDDLLNHSIYEASALQIGHLKHENKHYSCFLDFPRLFASLRSKIILWMKSQIEYINNVSKPDDPSWEFCCYDPYGALRWASEIPREIGISSQVRNVSKAELAAPPKEAKERKKFLFLIPAIASGETVRRCIEFASRFNPPSILVLTIVARMDSPTLSFYRGITQFCNARVRFSRLLDFPIGSYGDTPSTCPMCQDHAELLQIASLAKNCLPADSKFFKALQRRIAETQPSSVIFSERSSSDFSKEGLDKLLMRTKLRALYEAAGLDIPSRHALNQLLGLEENIRIFLDIVSQERNSKQFAMPELEKRLYKVAPEIFKYLHIILLGQSETCSFGSLAGSVLHLAPNFFFQNWEKVLAHYPSSSTDVEDALICLVRTGIRFSGATQSQFFKEKADQGTKRLISEVESLSRSLHDSFSREFHEAISTAERMLSFFLRSYPFAFPIEELAMLVLNDESEKNDLLQLLRDVRKSWREEISGLVNHLVTSRIWSVISKREPEIGLVFSDIEGLMVKLIQFEQKLLENPSEWQEIGKQIQSVAAEINKCNIQIGEKMQHFFFSPLHCNAIKNLPDSFNGNDGLAITVGKEIDYSVPKVFCDISDLNFSCEQIIDNWLIFCKSESKVAEVKFSLRLIGTDVSFEFWDNWPGSFDLQSMGGLRFVQDFVSSSGGRVEISPWTKEAGKSIIILLPSLRPAFDDSFSKVKQKSSKSEAGSIIALGGK